MKKSDKEKKTRTISARCTEKDYNTLLYLAQGKDMNLSDYLLETKLPTRAYRAKNKRIIPKLVNIQEHLNILAGYLAENTSYDPFLNENIIKIQEEVTKIWES